MSQFSADLAQDAYPEGIEAGFWSLARHDIIDDALRNAAARGWRSSSGRILEIGCGPGIVVAAMRARQHDIRGVELGHPTVRAKSAPFVTIGTRAEDLPLQDRMTVETLMLLDVIEHIETPIDFLGSILASFPACTCVLITVPARPEVWSNYDTHFGHFRRYTQQSLDDEILKSGLSPQSTQYFFRSLYAVALILKKIGLRRDVSLSPPRHAGLQKLLAGLLGLETRMLRGSSVYGLSLLSLSRPIGR